VRVAIERNAAFAAWTGSASRSRSGPQPCAGGDELDPRQGSQLASQRLGRGGDHRHEGVRGCRFGLQRPDASHPEHPDRLGRPGCKLRRAGGVAAPGGRGGRLGDDGVTLAP
jgi:hypothetical protein